MDTPLAYDIGMVKIASTEAWRARALDDPWYAVAAHEGKGDKRWRHEEFYALGLSDWADFLEHWQRYASIGDVCLELGCGAGRITAPLTGHFGRVIATDVSDTMIELARQAAPAAEYHIVDGTQLPLNDGSVDAVFTAHVLQHFESAADVTALLCEARRVTRMGGTIMAHMLLRKSSEASPVARTRELKREVERRARRKAVPHTVARRYYADQVRGFFEAAGFTSVELHEFRTSSNNDPHPFWFGRALPSD